MPINRRLTVVIALLIIALAISLIDNAVQFTDRERLINQRLSLANELKNQIAMARQQLYPSPASANDIATGKDILAIPLEFHGRRVQIVPYDSELADSGWVVIDLPFALLAQVPNLDITLFYRVQNSERDHEQTIYPLQSAKDCLNSRKQRLEIPVSGHLSSLCGLRFNHENGTSWSFRIEDSKLIWKES